MCYNLREIHYDGTDGEWAGISIGYGNDGFENATIYYSSEAEATEGVIYELSEDRTYAIVTGYEGTATDVVIASEYEGVPVREIQQYSFGYGDAAELLVSIVIPDSVTMIGKYAFEECINLTSVTIGNGVTEIGKGVFSYCISLTNVEFGENVTSILDGAFMDCRGFTSFVIPDGVTKVEYGAFSGCSNLTSIVIPNSVTFIGEGVFDGCELLTGTTYGDAIYLGNTENPYLYLWKTTNQTMTSFTVPEDTKIIGDEAFAGCNSLASITLPDGVVQIGYSAFEDCVALTEIVLPKTLTSVIYTAFRNCSGLSEVYYGGTASDWENISIQSYGNDTLINATRYYYSETEPTEEGNFWYYDNGVVTKW